MGILDEFAPHETAWKLLGMSGGGASVGITTGMKLAGPSVGGVGGYFEIGDPTGRRYSLQFAGVSTAFGAGLAPKLTISYSLQDLVASQLYAGASLKQELSLGDLGGYFVAINLTKGTLGASGSVTLVFFNCSALIDLGTVSYGWMLGIWGMVAGQAEALRRSSAMAALLGTAAESQVGMAEISAIRGHVSLYGT